MNRLEKWLLKRLFKKVKKFSIAQRTDHAGYAITMDRLIIVLESDGIFRVMESRPGHNFFVGNLDKDMPFIG